LAIRKAAATPGPGAYETTSDVSNNGVSIKVATGSFRRPHSQRLDGPFFLQNAAGSCSTRSREMSAHLLHRDSGLSPADYEGLASKDVLLSRSPTAKVIDTWLIVQLPRA
jgi:hypothetical protein